MVASLFWALSSVSWLGDKRDSNHLKVAPAREVAVVVVDDLIYWEHLLVEVVLRLLILVVVEEEVEVEEEEEEEVEVEVVAAEEVVVVGAMLFEEKMAVVSMVAGVELEDQTLMNPQPHHGLFRYLALPFFNGKAFNKGGDGNNRGYI